MENRNMLTIIHGDDIVSSRKILEEEKRKTDNIEVITFDGSKISYTELATSVQSLSLFGNLRMILIENLLKGAVSKQKEEIFTFLSSGKLLDTVILWEEEEISKALLRKFFPKARIIICQPPQLLFRFLETIGYKQPAELLSLFYQVLIQTEADFVFMMLLRQFRYLLVAKDLGSKGLSSMQSWQSRKFEQQAGYFTSAELVSSYRNLLSIDYKIKTGKVPYSLKELIDIFLVSL